MDRMKPLPQGFLSHAAPSSEATAVPTPPAGACPTTRTVARRLAAIDAGGLPGQVVFPDHLRVSNTGGSSPLAHSASPRVVVKPQASQLPTFWVRISVTHLPLPNGENIDPICLVSIVDVSEIMVHRTEVIPDDADPDFKRALKLDATKYSAGDKLRFRVFDASEFEFEGTAEAVTDEQLKHITGGGVPLLCNFVVEVDKLTAIVDQHDADPTESLIYTQRLDPQKSQEGNSAPALILSLFPMKHHDMRVLQDDRKYLFNLEDEPDCEADRVISRHESLLDIIPSHLFAIQSAIACVSVEDHQSVTVMKNQEEAPTPIMSMIDEALQYKNSCLGFGSSVEVEHAQEHSDYSRLKSIMKKLKDAARERPEDFYVVNDLGAPVVLYGFVIGSLHNLKEDFGLSVDREAPNPRAEVDNSKLFDWWDVLLELKQGLLDHALENSTTQDFGVYQDSNGESVSSLEAGADCEFQWLLCRPYTNRVVALEMAWQEVKADKFKRTVSNEYTGENILHTLIVKNSEAKYNLSRHLDILFSKCITHPRFRMNLMDSKVTGRFFCPTHGGYVDLGQTPLHFAVALGSAETVRYLLKLCSDHPSRHKMLWQSDSVGNNVLHMCVRHNNTKMYDLLRTIFSDLEEVLEKSDWWLEDNRATITDDDNLKNGEGRTPVELAAVLGNRDFIRHIIEKDKITKWTYGNMSLSMFLVRDFDSYKTITSDRAPKNDRKYKKLSLLSKIIKNITERSRPRSFKEPSVLQLLVDNEQKLLLSELPVITGLLDHKWETFGRHLLIVWAVLISVIFTVFEINVYMKNPESSDPESSESKFNPHYTPAAILQVVFAATLLLCSFLYHIDQGLAPVVEVGHTGVALQFETHRVKDYFNLHITDLIYVGKPVWMMRQIHSAFVQQARKDIKLLEANQDSDAHIKLLEETKERLSLLLDEHSSLMVSNRMGDEATLQSASKERDQDTQPISKMNLRANMALKAAVEVANCMILVARLIFNVFVRSIFSGLDSMIQFWSVLVLVAAGLHSLEAENAEVAVTAILGIASMSFFLSFLMFYRVHKDLGPFMVLIKRMLLSDLGMWIVVVVLFILGTAQTMYIILDDDMSFLYAYQWMLGDSTTDFSVSHDIYQVYIVLLFVVLTLVLSVALLNTLVAMFAATYEQVMGAAQAEWLLQRAQILLLIERVLYFLPAVFLYPLGYRVLQASKGKRKTILRFVQLPGGKEYHWVNTRCCARNALDPNHNEVCQEALGAEKASAAFLGPNMSFPLKWYSYWTAQVPPFIASYHQVENDDDFVYLLQMVSEDRGSGSENGN